MQPERVGGSTHKSSRKIAYSGQRSHIRPCVSVSVSWQPGSGAEIAILGLQFPVKPVSSGELSTCFSVSRTPAQWHVSVGLYCLDCNRLHVVICNLNWNLQLLLPLSGLLNSEGEKVQRSSLRNAGKVYQDWGTTFQYITHSLDHNDDREKISDTRHTHAQINYDLCVCL